MGDKNYLAIVAGWLAHCLYRLGRYDEAAECAGVCESSAAKSLVYAQVLWKGARGMLLARQGDVEAGEALAREAVELALRTDRADTQTDALMSLAEVLRRERPSCGGRTRRRRCAPAIRAEGGVTGRKPRAPAPRRTEVERRHRDVAERLRPDRNV